MKAKYIGDPRNPGEAKNLPDTYEAFGVTFERGKWAEVPDRIAPKLVGNSHFETQGKGPKAETEEVVPAPVEPTPEEGRAQALAIEEAAKQAEADKAEAERAAADKAKK